MLMLTEMTVRTPLNHIIKYIILPDYFTLWLTMGHASCLELALDGKLDIETRENLSQSHAASKVRFLVLDILWVVLTATT